MNRQGLEMMLGRLTEQRRYALSCGEPAVAEAIQEAISYFKWLLEKDFIKNEAFEAAVL